MAAGYTTVNDVYEQVLEGINKTNSPSLSPSEFESLANECQLKLVKNTAAAVELNQKKIDDLGSLVKVDLLNPLANTNVIDFLNANVTSNGPLVVNNPAIPGRHKYLQLLRLEIQWKYKNNPCYDDGIASPDVWVRSKPMKADKDLEKDYYNRPTDERPYHQFLSSLTSERLLVITNNTDSLVNKARMQYVVYPRHILLDPTGNSNFDINISMREELVRLMVQTYLERIESRRTQSVQQVESKNYS